MKRGGLVFVVLWVERGYVSVICTINYCTCTSTYLPSSQATSKTQDSQNGANSPYLLDCPSYKERADKAMDRLIQQVTLPSGDLPSSHRGLNTPWMMVLNYHIDRKCLEGIPSRQYQKHYHISTIQRYTISFVAGKIILHS